MMYFLYLILAILPSNTAAMRKHHIEKRDQCCMEVKHKRRIIINSLPDVRQKFNLLLTAVC